MTDFGEMRQRVEVRRPVEAGLYGHSTPLGTASGFHNNLNGLQFLASAKSRPTFSPTIAIGMGSQNEPGQAGILSRDAHRGDGLE